jgi:hypothetical protein
MKYLESIISKSNMKINKERVILDKQLKTMEEKAKAFNALLYIINSEQDDPNNQAIMVDKYYEIRDIILNSLEEIERLKSMFKKEDK